MHWSNPPPLGFFKGFVSRKVREQKNEFDINPRAMNAFLADWLDFCIEFMEWLE